MADNLGIEAKTTGIAQATNDLDKRWRGYFRAHTLSRVRRNTNLRNGCRQRALIGLIMAIKTIIILDRSC
jgi:hypothetical protein